MAGVLYNTLVFIVTILGTPLDMDDLGWLYPRPGLRCGAFNPTKCPWLNFFTLIFAFLNPSTIDKCEEGAW